MKFALGVFILSLIGADGPVDRESCERVGHKVATLTIARGDAPAGGDHPAIAYDVRVIRLNGLEWRGAFFSQLQPIGGRSTGSIWTATRETAERLAELDPHGWKAPRVTAASQGLAHLTDRSNRKIASVVTRLADGPFDHATQVAYTPQYEEIRDGLALTMTGRKLDQGVLACVVLDDTRLAAIHQVAVSENVSTKACCPLASAPACGKIAAHIEVPEVAHTSLAGEWLIPNDGVLVISLGVQTSADAAGKAVVAERLVLIEAAATIDNSAERVSLSQTLPAEVNKPADAAEAGIPMPMPAMPSRSLPQALDASGSPLALPPLPDDRITPSSLPGSSEPCASPQNHNRKLSEPATIDAGSSRAGFNPAPQRTPADADKNDAVRPYVLRFPVKAGGMDVEVEIRMTAPCPVLEQLGSPAPPRPQK